MNASRLETLKKFLKEEPNDAFTLYAIALEYASMNNLTEAITRLEQLLVLDRTYVPAYQQLGNYLRQNGKPGEAVQILQRGIQAATLSGDTHAQSEMQEVIDELEDAL